MSECKPLVDAYPMSLQFEMKGFILIDCHLIRKVLENEKLSMDICTVPTLEGLIRGLLWVEYENIPPQCMSWLSDMGADWNI